MNRILEDEIVRRRTYTMSYESCLILDSLASFSQRRKAEVLSVAIYNLAYGISEIQRSKDLGLKAAIATMEDRVHSTDAYISLIIGEGSPPVEGGPYRRTYSYSVITRQIVDNLSMLAEYEKSCLVNLAVLNLAYDAAVIRSDTDDTLASAIRMIESKIGSRDMYSYVPFNSRLSGDVRSSLDDFIFQGKSSFPA